MTGLGSSCGACKFLRRRCAIDCIFAPYFCHEQASTHFAAVHKVFGASNVSKLLLHLPVHNRSDAALTISYEALARMRDPVYGCVAHILALQQQVAKLQAEVEFLGNYITNHHMMIGVPTNDQQQQDFLNFSTPNEINNNTLFYQNQQLGSPSSSSAPSSPSNGLMSDQVPQLDESSLVGSNMEETYNNIDDEILGLVVEGEEEDNNNNNDNNNVLGYYHPWLDVVCGNVICNDVVSM